MDGEDREEKIKGWNKAVKCSFGWAKEDEEATSEAQKYLRNLKNTNDKN